MSQRTIVEFNHDYASEFDNPDSEFMTAIRMALSSGSKEAWRRLERYGMTRVVQLHHSDDRKVVTKHGEYPFG